MASLRHRFLQWSFQTAAAVSAWRDTRPKAPLAPHEIAVITAYTAHLAEYGDIAVANRRTYVARHGYAFQALTSGFDSDRPPSWSKIKFIRHALRTHRFVFWTDADALIMNHSIRLESFVMPGIDVHLSRALAPFPHINAGQMLFRASPFTSLFLDAVWRLDVFTHDSTWEQRAINYLVEHYRLPRVGISPNRLFNSYGHALNDPDPYQAGDFVIHFPGLSDKASLMKKYAALQANSERAI